MTAGSRKPGALIKTVHHEINNDNDNKSNNNNNNNNNNSNNMITTTMMTLSFNYGHHYLSKTLLSPLKG